MFINTCLYRLNLSLDCEMKLNGPLLSYLLLLRCGVEEQPDQQEPADAAEGACGRAQPAPARHLQTQNQLVCWLVVFNVPSTARSFRDGTPIYCPLRRT